MSESVKAILQLLALVATILGLINWLAIDRPDRITWCIRIGAPLVVALVIWLHAVKRDPPDSLPDHLSQASPLYFERDGFCFGATLTAAAGLCWLQIFFQNRFAGACIGRVVLQPHSRLFRSAGLPRIDRELLCDGGAFGVVRIPFPIPRAAQGKPATFDVECKARYPNGRGKPLRSRRGIRAGAPENRTFRLLLNGGLLFMGVFGAKAARIRLTLPANVAEAPDPTVTESPAEILWRPELPTGGFPVLPAKSTPQASL